MALTCLKCAVPCGTWHLRRPGCAPPTRRWVRVQLVMHHMCCRVPRMYVLETRYNNTKWKTKQQKKSHGAPCLARQRLWWLLHLSAFCSDWLCGVLSVDPISAPETPLDPTALHDYTWNVRKWMCGSPTRPCDGRVSTRAKIAASAPSPTRALRLSRLSPHTSQLIRPRGTAALTRSLDPLARAPHVKALAVLAIVLAADARSARVGPRRLDLCALAPLVVRGDRNRGRGRIERRAPHAVVVSAGLTRPRVVRIPGADARVLVARSLPRHRLSVGATRARNGQVARTEGAPRWIGSGAQQRPRSACLPPRAGSVPRPTLCSSSPP